jgi:DNA-binding response OmpR family regulator
VVLLADSDEEVVEAVRMALDGAFEVISAVDGGNALALAFEEKPALVLLERHLPVLDGVRVCQVLRSQDETAATPVAFLSAEASSEDMQRCYAAGADDYIVKPFGSRELAGKIRQLLTRRSVSRPPV